MRCGGAVFMGGDKRYLSPILIDSFQHFDWDPPKGLRLPGRRLARRKKADHEYRRRPAWAYPASWDVHRACVFGWCDEPFNTPIRRPRGRSFGRFMRADLHQLLAAAATRGPGAPAA